MELVRVRTQTNRVDFVFYLVVDPGFDQVLGENASLKQELVILGEGIQSLDQRSRDRWQTG